MADAVFLAVDWGTTNRRVYTIDADGAVIATERDDRGVLSIAADDFPAEVAGIRARFADLPMLCAGMVGSVRGWVGGRMIISPNTNVDVISAAVARGVVSLPGYFTPTEALSALAAGASGLKLFPAEAVTPAVLKAHRAVLPRDTPIFAVGGVTPDLMHAWLTAGATGFGLGSALYRPGVTPAEVSTAARRFVGALPEDPNGNALSCS